MGSTTSVTSYTQEEVSLPTEAEIKATALKLPIRIKKTLAAKSLAEESFKKFLLQGHTGTGKTRTIAEVLQTLNSRGKPTKVFVASTDLGGSGLGSVKDRLLAVGRADLLPNVVEVDFDDFETFDGFVRGALVPTVGNQTLWQWGPDVLVHDGFSNFQESHVWRYVLAIESISSKADEARTEEVQAGQVEWGQIRRCSLLAIDLFNRLKNPLTGDTPSKIVTVLLDDGKEDKFTHETKKGPLVIGATRSYMAAAFDYILTTKAITKPGSKVPEYSYTCDVGGGSLSKQRGGEFNKIPEAALKGADFKTIWETLVTPSASKTTEAK